VSGTEKALAFRLTPIAAVMMGAISGAGGYVFLIFGEFEER
jgi:uncharacterized membrane protein YeiH